MHVQYIFTFKIICLAYIFYFHSSTPTNIANYSYTCTQIVFLFLKFKMTEPTCGADELKKKFFLIILFWFFSFHQKDQEFKIKSSLNFRKIIFLTTQIVIKIIQIYPEDLHKDDIN